MAATDLTGNCVFDCTGVLSIVSKENGSFVAVQVAKTLAEGLKGGTICSTFNISMAQINRVS